MRPIRNCDPNLFRLISIRTCEARLYMVPSRKIEKLLGGILARYQEIFKIEIYAYFFLSNHFHLLIRSPNGNTDEFMENLNREIAHRMNRKLGKSGKFWERRYDDIPVGDAEGDILRAFLYVTTNATRHGLLKDSKKWPGLNSYHHCLKERDREFTFYHYSAENEEEKTTRHKLRLSILPDFAKLTQKERQEKIGSLLSEKIADYAQERAENNQGFLGLENIIYTKVGELPNKISRSKRPVCYTQCLATLIRKRKEERARREAYCDASFEYRLGNLLIQFPSFSFRPPTHRISRLEKFQPLAPYTVPNSV